jgi:hypothetical protein
MFPPAQLLPRKASQDRERFSILAIGARYVPVVFDASMPRARGVTDLGF